MEYVQCDVFFRFSKKCGSFFFLDLVKVYMTKKIRIILLNLDFKLGTIDNRKDHFNININIQQGYLFVFIIVDDKHILNWISQKNRDKFSSVKEQAFNCMWDGINWKKGG